MLTGDIRGKNKMWVAIEAGDFELARQEALDSLWAKQTPNRAIKVSAGLV